jgi:hypothetical protein
MKLLRSVFLAVVFAQGDYGDSYDYSVALSDAAGSDASDDPLFDPRGRKNKKTTTTAEPTTTEAVTTTTTSTTTTTTVTVTTTSTTTTTSAPATEVELSKEFLVSFCFLGG